MDLIKGDVISVNSNNYIVIETLNYNYDKYAFVNELNENDDIGDNYYIFKIENDSAIKLTDEEMINKLMTKFKDLINEDINDIITINEG